MPTFLGVLGKKIDAGTDHQDKDSFKAAPFRPPTLCLGGSVEERLTAMKTPRAMQPLVCIPYGSCKASRLAEFEYN